VEKNHFFTKALLGKLRSCERLDFLDIGVAFVENPLKEIENSLLRSTSLAPGLFIKKKRALRRR
jgi:hypothetical protein